MIVFLLLLTLLYVLLFLCLALGFMRVQEISATEYPLATFSIIIPFRNEEKGLSALLESIEQIDYPPSHFEVILINDQSRDGSEKICQEYIAQHPHITVGLLQSPLRSGSPKKNALATGIKVAQKEYILTTDADCQVPQNWLNEFSRALHQKKAQLLAGPVLIGAHQGDRLDQFQELEFFCLQSVTMGAFGLDTPIMCNGANLCYHKESFKQVGGFSGNQHIAGGDDMFLLEKFQQSDLRTAFLKSHSAVVLTAPQKNLRDLIEQHKRWAAKATAGKNVFSKMAGAVVLLMNVLWLWIPIGVLTETISLTMGAGIILVKLSVDFIPVLQMALLTNRTHILWNYLWSSLLYPFFSVYVTLRATGSFRWKDRVFKK